MPNERRRTPITAPEPFEDPIENYDAPTYANDLERTLAETSVMDIRHQPMTKVTPDTSIENAMSAMEETASSCVLVAEGDKLLGVFCERDVLNRVAEEFDNVRLEPVSTVMTPGPVCLHETDTAAAALCVMAESGFRHVPILDVDHCLTGIVSPRRMVGALKLYEPTVHDEPTDDHDHGSTAPID